MGYGYWLFKIAMARLRSWYQIRFQSRTRWWCQNHSQELEERWRQTRTHLEPSLNEWIIWPNMRISRMHLTQTPKEAFGLPNQLSCSKLWIRLRRKRDKRKLNNSPKNVRSRIKHGNPLFPSKVAQSRKGCPLQLPSWTWFRYQGNSQQC